MRAIDKHTILWVTSLMTGLTGTATVVANYEQRSRETR